VGFQSREGLIWSVLLGLTLLGARFLAPDANGRSPAPRHIADEWQGECDDGATDWHRYAPPPPPRTKKKLRWAPGAGFRIVTVRGVGYRLELDE
jgi:hypothetical protein